MALSETTEITTYLTPQEPVALHLAQFLDQAKDSIHFMIYGATHPLFFQALMRAYRRGVEVKGIFDHTQACGRTEAAQLHGLFLVVPPAQFRIGTSEVAHQIVHEKGAWIDQSSVWSGSWNFSPDAEKQVNHVDIIPSAQRAAYFESAFQSLWAYISQFEEQYQPH